MLFQTSYSDSEGEDFDLGTDDEFIQPINCNSSVPLNCLSIVDQVRQHAQVNITYNFSNFYHYIIEII